MHTEDCTFFSDGLRLAGRFFWPDDNGVDAEPRPLVVACSGFTGLCSIHPARFARRLTSDGLPCFCLDYRGFADSEGERGRVVLEEQVRDIIHGSAFAAQHGRVDERKLFLLGWGLGAGLVLDAARAMTGVRGILGIDGFYCGRRVQRAWRGERGLVELQDEIDAERAQRVTTGWARKTDAFHFYPLNPRSQDYVDRVLRTYDDYDTARYSFEIGDSLMRWHPESFAPFMSVPLLIAHSDDNRLHPPSEAISLSERYGGPTTLHVVRAVATTSSPRRLTSETGEFA